LPSSAVQNFSDPDEYATSIRATQYELTVTGRGKFAANLVRIDLHDLWMQRFSSNLPWVAHAANMGGRAVFIFQSDPGPDLLLGNARMGPSSIDRMAEGQVTFQRAAGPVTWGALSLPIGAIEALGVAAGFDLTPPREAVTLTPSAAMMGGLQRLHAVAGHLAWHTPEIIANPAAAKGLEQQFVQALIVCLRQTSLWEDRSALRRHALVMRRFHEAIKAWVDSPVYLPELCSAIGVSDRTLRACCQEHLGMGPFRYLWLRRMQLTRRALALAETKSSTVTEIATTYGFWELGRFAVA
jgi:AraC-like DNA-binding protein